MVLIKGNDVRVGAPLFKLKHCNTLLNYEY
jgi:hypothetical protein